MVFDLSVDGDVLEDLSASLSQLSETFDGLEDDDDAVREALSENASELRRAVDDFQGNWGKVRKTLVSDCEALSQKTAELAKLAADADKGLADQVDCEPAP